jgi:hypothetical protein
MSEERAQISPQSRAALERVFYLVVIRKIRNVGTSEDLIQSCNRWRQLLAQECTERSQWAHYCPRTLREMWDAMGRIAQTERIGGDIPLRPKLLNDVEADNITEGLIQDMLRAIDTVVKWCEVKKTSLAPRANEQHDTSNEEIVREYVATNPDAMKDEAAESTGLTATTIERTQAWKDHDDKRVENYIVAEKKEGREPSIKGIMWLLKCSKGYASERPPWRKHRDSIKRSVRERTLTDNMQNILPDDADRSLTAENRDEIFVIVLEASDPQTRKRFEKLSLTDRSSLIDYILSAFADADPNARTEQERKSLLVLLAEGWLDQREQDRRRNGRHH